MTEEQCNLPCQKRGIECIDDSYCKRNTKMTKEIIINECFNCKKKRDIADNWRNCKLKCSYKYKRRENDEITRLKQENFALRRAIKDINIVAVVEESEKLKQENEKLKETASLYENLYNHHGEVVEGYSKLRNKATLYRIALEEIREMLCKGKTFYNGYWDNPETFTQTDKIILKINEVLG